MAKKQKTDEKPKKEKKPSKKRGKKWIIIVVLIIILAAIVAYALAWFGFINPPQNKYLSMIGLEPVALEMSEEYFEDLEETVVVEPVTIEPIEAPPITVEEEEEPIPSHTPSFYISVGSCIYNECVERVQNELQRHDLEHTSTKTKKQTQYHEVTSETKYSKERAEDKIRIINKYNELFGFPTLKRVGTDQYKITFGQFPELETANRMKSHLSRLYPQIKIEFGILLKKSHYTVINIYAGPLSEEQADAAFLKLNGNPLLDDVKVVKNL